MCGAIPPRPQYAFMELCSVKTTGIDLFHLTVNGNRSLCTLLLFIVGWLYRCCSNEWLGYGLGDQVSIPGEGRGGTALEWVELYLHSTSTSSRLGAWLCNGHGFMAWYLLKHRGNFTIRSFNCVCYVVLYEEWQESYELWSGRGVEVNILWKSEAKGKVVPVLWGRIGGVELCIHAFLTSALDGGEWSALRLSHFTPRERPSDTHVVGGWVGPRAGLDVVLKRKIPSPCRDSNWRSSKLNCFLSEVRFGDLTNTRQPCSHVM
jgi:hypothetical protein